MARSLTAHQRFEQHVSHNGPIPLVRGVNGRCWLWTAATNERGYGKFWDGTRMVRAHRWSYAHRIGPIPAGLEIDHRCNNRRCVRPSHLAATTHAANTLRSTGPTAINARKTQCPAGHPYDAANTRRKRDGSRCCRTCERSRKSRPRTLERQAA